VEVPPPVAVPPVAGLPPEREDPAVLTPPVALLPPVREVPLPSVFELPPVIEEEVPPETEEEPPPVVEEEVPPETEEEPLALASPTVPLAPAVELLFAPAFAVKAPPRPLGLAPVPAEPAVFGGRDEPGLLPQPQIPNATPTANICASFMCTTASRLDLCVNYSRCRSL
jgi:hypothetical protein